MNTATAFEQMAFQPTLPARGATAVPRTTSASVQDFNPRSPHGERHDGRRRTSAAAKDFNPRSPHGERRAQDAPEYVTRDISTHAPRTGSDTKLPSASVKYSISTHAPRTGSDRHHNWEG